jgi:MoxR-like ATPase
MITLLAGPAGCGKTYYAQQRAQSLDACFIEYMCHAWTSAEDFFMGIDVTAAVAGDASNVPVEGVLVQAARASQLGVTVLLLDELDKASEKVENLLLQFLQSGLAPIGPGRYVQANLDNLEVYITTNEFRQHGDPLLRRTRRVWMDPMSDEKIISLLSIPENVAKAVLKVAQLIATHEDSITSLQEYKSLVKELNQARSIEFFREAFKAHVARTRKGADFASKMPQITTLYGLYRS